MEYGLGWDRKEKGVRVVRCWNDAYGRVDGYGWKIVWIAFELQYASEFLLDFVYRSVKLVFWICYLGY